MTRRSHGWLRAKVLAAALISLTLFAGANALRANGGEAAPPRRPPAMSRWRPTLRRTPQLASAEPPPDTRGLDEEIQNLKKDVVDLNKDLFVLEEELLFPANTQVAVFVSMDVGEFFALDNVTLKIDQKEVANYLYTPREAEALLKGGVHRIYLGNLKVGEHELVAFFTGKGPNERDYKRGATVQVREGHRREVPGAQDQRPAEKAAAGVRDQGLGIRVGWRSAIAASIAGRLDTRCRAGASLVAARCRCLAQAAKKNADTLPVTDGAGPALRRCPLLLLSRERLRGDHAPQRL